MLDPTYVAYLFSALIAFVVLFQFALALGVPWGEMALGGKYPGRLPSRMRIAALIQVVVLIDLCHLCGRELAPKWRVV